MEKAFKAAWPLYENGRAFENLGSLMENFWPFVVYNECLALNLVVRKKKKSLSFGLT